jgi:hypothetical protein
VHKATKNDSSATRGAHPPHLPRPRSPHLLLLAAALALALALMFALAAEVAFGAAPTGANDSAVTAAALSFSAIGSLESTPTTPSPEPTPTPVPTRTYARNASWHLRLNLPASPADLLAVGFHQASGKKVLMQTPTSSVIRIYKPIKTKKLLGKVAGLKMFQQALRGRGTSNMTAADCAVKPNSVILSPSTGTVMLVKNYRLYGVYRDVQLEIQPDGASPKIRVVVLHIQDPKVKVGDRVQGGVTPIATVRHFRFLSSVNRYLPVKYADHTHIQINRK